MSRALTLLVLLCLGSTSLAQEWAEVPAGVPLQRDSGASEAQRLDIGLVIFDEGSERPGAGEVEIFPEVRRAEARYMPVLLRQVLQDSDAWGVVRVLPEATVLPELLVSGEIIHSDGLQLALRVRAVDATGQLWLDRHYRDHSETADYPVSQDADPFMDLYRQLANDLLELRRQLPAQALRDIRRVALLRYAAFLSPEAFGGYLGGGEEGAPLTVQRLPAQGDPMMQRVQRIRNKEFLFIDTVDEQYLDLFQSMAPIYNLWRQYSREQALYVAEYQQRASQRKSRGRRGSFTAMQQNYDTYRNLKIQQQDLGEQALGFNNEVAPTVLEASGRVFRLNGTLDSQYTDWRGILREIFLLESGLPATG